MPLILDASVTITWCFADQSTPQTDAVLDDVRKYGGIVPALWHTEIANILSRAERANHIDSPAVDMFLSRLDHLDIKTDSPTASVHRKAVLSLVRRFGLTAYDATYLELALRVGGTLASLDQALRVAGLACGIRCRP